MVTLKEYKTYLRVKRIIEAEGCDIISKLINGNNCIPFIVSTDDAKPIKYHSLSAAAKDCGVTKQTFDYAHRNKSTRIVRRKGGIKEFRIQWL